MGHAAILYTMDEEKLKYRLAGRPSINVSVITCSTSGAEQSPESRRP